jgi:gliding motility-associated protein GldM
MAGGNLSPRQKMIGMMYLVLTALLALNVQKEVLDAFVIVNDGIETTTVNFAKKNNFTYDAFKFQLSQDQVKVKPYYDKALEVKKLSSDLVGFIQGLKSELYVEADKIKRETADTFHLKYLESKDNQEIPSHYMVGDGQGDKGKAQELRVKIEEYKTKVTNLLKGMKDADKIALGMSTADPKGSIENGKLSWGTDNFEHRPLAAVITILSKYQSDVRNAESNVLDYLYSQIDAGSFKVDNFNAMAVASSEVVMQGMDYKADIFLGASSKTQDPQILVGGSPIKASPT